MEATITRFTTNYPDAGPSGIPYGVSMGFPCCLIKATVGPNPRRTPSRLRGGGFCLFELGVVLPGRLRFALLRAWAREQDANLAVATEGFVCVSSRQRGDFPLSFRHLAYPRLQYFNDSFYGVRRFFFALTDVSRSHPPGRRMYPGAQPEGNMEAPLESPLENAPQKAPPSRCASTSFELSSTRRANSRPATGKSLCITFYFPFGFGLIC